MTVLSRVSVARSGRPGRPQKMAPPAYARQRCVSRRPPVHCPTVCTTPSSGNHWVSTAPKAAAHRRRACSKSGRPRNKAPATDRSCRRSPNFLHHLAAAAPCLQNRALHRCCMNLRAGRSAGVVSAKNMKKCSSLAAGGQAGPLSAAAVHRQWRPSSVRPPPVRLPPQVPRLEVDRRIRVRAHGFPHRQLRKGLRPWPRWMKSTAANSRHEATYGARTRSPCHMAISTRCWRRAPGRRAVVWSDWGAVSVAVNTPGVLYVVNTRSTSQRADFGGQNHLHHGITPRRAQLRAAECSLTPGEVATIDAKRVTGVGGDAGVQRLVSPPCCLSSA